MPSSSGIKTKLFGGTNELDISQAAQALREGHLIAFPTETVYGLGADATNNSAVASIYSAKGRPSDNPLIVHLSSVTDLNRWSLTPPLSEATRRLTKVFWPGPLTIVLPLAHSAKLATTVTAGLSSVGLRVPKHPIASALLAKAAIPIAAPSANISGRPSPTSADHVVKDLSGKIYGIVDGGDLAHSCHLDVCGLESTIVDLTNEQHPTVLRPGAISIAELEKVSGLRFFKHCNTDTSHSQKPKAPGMKYRHYAPKAPLTLVLEKDLQHEIDQRLEKKQIVGILADERICADWNNVCNVVTVVCGKGDDESSFAKQLYAALRCFDGEGKYTSSQSVDIILAVAPKHTSDGIGEAVMNRLSKAAAGR